MLALVDDFWDAEKADIGGVLISGLLFGVVVATKHGTVHHFH